MSLSSLIVQREIASIREIEEALARQVLYGGDFVTNLFEVSRIEEAALMPVVAESYGLPVAPAGELPKVPDIAARLVAAEVAAERAFVPLEVGATLVVAVAEPLSRDAEQELTFALALAIEQRIAPLFRIRQALARDYGLPLDKRTTRLITKVVHKGPRIASTFPPPLESSPLHRAAPRPPSIAPPPLPSMEPPRTTAAAQGTFVRKSEAPPARPARRRRGPLTSDLAKSELEASAERDVIFDVLFEFSRQFFDYTALFIVHGDLAEGRDAFGDGAARDKVARVGVPLDLRNILATAREAKTIVRARPSSEGLDPVLMADLGRAGDTECVVFPIVVRKRVVALLFGDGGLSGVDDIGVRQVEDLVESSSGAFERVIMRRKLKGSAAPPEGGAAVAKKKAADTVPPPPTQVSGPPEPAWSGSSVRPAVEELAPPIRDLLAEPVSRPLVTLREPTAVLGADPMSVRSDRPPPANLLAVRRPSGRPIPREEPEAAAALEGTGAPSAPPRSSGGSPSGAPRRSQPIKRAEAPALEFGAPSLPSVVTESASWGFAASTADDAVERQLIAQIHGHASDPPHTTRDSGPARAGDRDPSGGPEVHPWGGDARASRRSSVSDALGALPQSPRAESPPPMPSAPITDLSPQPIGPIDLGGTASLGVQATPFAQQITVSDDAPSSATPDAGAPSSGTPDFTTTLVAGSPLLPRVEPSGANAPAAGSPGGFGALPAAAPSFGVMAPSLDEGSFDLVAETAKPITPLVVVTPDQEMKPVALGTLTDLDATPIAPAVFVADAARPSSVSASEPPSRNAEPVLALAQRKGAPPALPPAAESKPMPLSEQQVSVPAHKPPSSRSDHSRILPSVIVDVSSEYVTLVDRVLAGADEEAETALLRAGGYAMPAIMAKFPGPIAIESERLEGAHLPRVAECGPVIRLIASQRRTALPFVLAHVEGADPDARFWATYLLTELVYPDAIDAAIARTFDEDARVRRAARAAARAIAEAHPQPVVERLGEIANTQAATRRVWAIEALAETREPLAVPVLLPLLEEDIEDVVAAARSALVAITQQDFGRDTERWLVWWGDNRGRHRLEWLIDSLMHDQQALRGSASEELRTITNEYFAYYDDLPKRERERAQTRYREWWENVGRVRFSRASTRGA
ncbi:MAG: hypothetical protein KF764_28825 [Labilithrix sp.]|nr:hypothetical protein [Labilithrix sp.]